MIRPDPFPGRPLARLVSALGAAVLLLALTGCGDNLSRAFGFERDSPDEFRVTTRAPLSMPPDYALQPPHPGQARPQELSERAAAEATLAPEAALSGPGAPSAGQQALVAAAGPKASPNIRRQVDADAAIDRPSQSFTDRLMFWTDTPTPGTVIDPQKEADRLRTNTALGRSAQTGDTPIVQKEESKGWFDNLF